MIEIVSRNESRKFSQTPFDGCPRGQVSTPTIEGYGG